MAASLYKMLCTPAIARTSLTRARSLKWKSCFVHARGFSLDSSYCDGKRRVAILYQALDPPLINGARKPKKPGGYKDSSADIAYVLKHHCAIDVATPAAGPDPGRDEGWVFADTEEGISEAIKQKVTHLWANTILFAQHPLQTSKALDHVQKSLRVVGQPPKLVELFDDKDRVNSMLRARTNQGFRLPGAQTVHDSAGLATALAQLDISADHPIVGKPVRGRGSYGVKVCRNCDELTRHAQQLLAENSPVILEEFLGGQEGTVTVMPPSKERPEYWALPMVVRFNHQDDIAPYNGVVAVIRNSRVIPEDEARADPAFQEIATQCVNAAKLLRVTAPIRIDVRRVTADNMAPFAIFDVNMKPNMTGPGRPGREDQASLTALAATGIGWDYPTLLYKILASSSTLDELRNVEEP